MTPDLIRLKQSFRVLRSFLENIEFEYTDDPAWTAPSDTSYLTAEDLANPDIASNVDAMNETNEKIAWFGRDDEGFVGLWRGPQLSPLESAPVVRLDTEGQYRVVARTVADYLLISSDHADFPSNRRTLMALGFDASRAIDEIWSSIEEVAREPNEFRDQLYRIGRAQRGMS